VGFVGAAESKAALAGDNSNVPFLTLHTSALFWLISSFKDVLGVRGMWALRHRTWREQW